MLSSKYQTPAVLTIALVTVALESNPTHLENADAQPVGLNTHTLNVKNYECINEVQFRADYDEKLQLLGDENMQPLALKKESFRKPVEFSF